MTSSTVRPSSRSRSRRGSWCWMRPAHLSPPLIPNFRTIPWPSASHCTAKRPTTNRTVFSAQETVRTMFWLKTIVFVDLLKDTSDEQIVGTQKTSAAPCYRGADNIPGPLLSPTFALLKKPPNMAEIYGTRRLAEAKVSNNKMWDYICSFFELI